MSLLDHRHLKLGPHPAADTTPVPRTEPSTSALDDDPTPSTTGSEQGVVYLLVFNDPDDPVEDYGLGWTLVVCPDTGELPRWSSSLACYGAGAYAGLREAQTAASEVLAAHRVQVAGWQRGLGPAALMFRATCAHNAADTARGALSTPEPALRSIPEGRVPHPRRG